MTQLSLFPTPTGLAYKAASAIKTVGAFVSARATLILVILGILAASGAVIRHYARAAAEARCEARVATAGTVVLEAARRADTAALGKADTIKGGIASEETKNRAITTDALKKNPDWAGQPVPAAVSDSLRR